MDKSQVQQVLDSSPEEVDLDAFVERLYLLRKIQLSEEALVRGEGVPHEEALQKLAPWLN